LALQVFLQPFDLGAFTGAVDAGESNKYRTQATPSEKHIQRGLFGTRPGLAAERAATVPSAAPAPAMNPKRISQERIWCCLGGAIATPAGFEAALPLT
jgi:hypothetical protein